MRRKNFHIILLIFSLVIFSITTLLFMGCLVRYIADPSSRAIQDEDDKEEAIRREFEQKEQTEAEKEEPAEEAGVAEEGTEEAAASKEEKVGSFPSEPITYTGDISGVAVNLTVDFKSTNVFGRIQNPSGVYDDFIVTEGNIDLDTLEVNAIFWGITEIDSDNNEIYSEWTLKGRVSHDLSIFTGILLDNEGEIGEFTANR
ncbi:hypothetical protein ACFLQS_02625 [Actinomycetota bacterium]